MQVKNEMEQKKSIVKRYNINKVIDDMPGYINDFAGLEQINGIYVPKKPWNHIVQETEKVKIIDKPQKIIKHAYKIAA